MPSRHIVKTYVKDGYYHVYNRGVEKRIIFEDEQDYKVFLNYLKGYVTPIDKIGIKKTFTLQGLTFKGVARQPKNYSGKIEILVFCLMPNHFHLVIKTLTEDSLKKFMQSLMTRYTIYFNKKNDRVGSLFQGTYKGVLVSDENYLLHLSRYIHLNPSEITNNLESYYSSYGNYLGLRRAQWLKPEIILDQFNNKVGVEFKKINNYKDFVEKYKQEDKMILGNLAID